MTWDICKESFDIEAVRKGNIAKTKEDIDNGMRIWKEWREGMHEVSDIQKMEKMELNEVVPDCFSNACEERKAAFT